MTRYQAIAVGQSIHCVICGSSLSFHQQWAGDICDDWRCRWVKLDREMEAHRKKAARALGIKQPEVYRALVVPHRPGIIDVLPAKRRKAHLDYLNKQMMEVVQGATGNEEPCIGPDDSASGPPAELATAVCAVCAGACCQRAGDHAFLDTAAIARLMAANPGMESSDISSTYAARLPERSIAGSCVYHTLKGCTLPRSRRAHICNTYRCSGLKQAERWAGNNGTSRVYVVARKDNIIKRSAFVQPGNIRHYPRRTKLFFA